MTTTITVRERPILMSAPMVRATLRGDKTQTRRVVVPSAHMKRYTDEWWGGFDDVVQANDAAGNAAQALVSVGSYETCPYGAPRDRLWVRESFRPSFGDPSVIHYAADVSECDRTEKGPWKPSIHMPRSASRLTLEITHVRVERLQDISEADATAEGIASCTKDGRLYKHGVADRDGYPGGFGWPWDRWKLTARDAYRVLWDSLNADRGFGWDSNPWVWCLSFRRVGGPS